MKLLRLVGRHAKPYTVWILGVFVFQAIATGAALALPGLNAAIIDRGVAAGDTGLIWGIGLDMLLVCAVQLMSAIAGIVLGARVATNVGRDLRRAVFHRVDGMETEQLAAFGVPTLITRATNDVQQVQILVLMTLNIFISAPIMTIGGIVLALREDANLAWLVWSAVILLVIVVGGLVLWVMPMFRQLQGRIDEINGVLREQIVGVRTVRAFVREAHETERYERVNAALTTVSVRVGQVFVVMFPVISMILHLASAAVLWFGGHQITAGELQIGSMTAFLQYLIQILVALMTAVFMVMMVPRAAVSAERIQEVLSVSDAHDEGRGEPAELPRGNRIEFTGVEYGYPGAAEPVVRDVSFTVEPGTTTAIVGATGSGKSTLVGLLAGFMRPRRGSVRVGGVDVARLSREQRSRVIGLVPQRATLFSGTVASNLRIANPEASDAALWAALDAAQAADFVRALDGGLDAPIAQGGSNVSGGQRQRLCIARALLADAGVLLLDDSFSALDAVTDARLRAALADTAAGVSRVIVAQRIASVADADQIIVLDGGTVAGMGTHEELLLSCAEYREIVASQTGDPDPDPDQAPGPDPETSLAAHAHAATVSPTEGTTRV